MDSKKYIIDKLDCLVSEFKGLKAIYGYDAEAKVHVVEIIPNYIYHHDDGYIEWEREMMTEFLSKFRGENICFISDDDIMGIEHVTYSCAGEDYVQENAIDISENAVSPYKSYQYPCSISIKENSAHLNVSLMDKFAVNIYKHRISKNMTGMQKITVYCDQSMSNYSSAA